MFFKFLATIMLLMALEANAVIEPRSMATDPRLKILNYHANQVHRLEGFYGFQTFLELEQGEQIKTITIGDSTAWQIQPNGNRIFLKPILENADTNMTVITNLRTYQFDLYAKEAYGLSDPGLTFSVKMIYPSAIIGNQGLLSDTNNLSPIPDLNRAEDLNFMYTISGSNAIAPLRIFDDGEFTYFKFRHKNAEIPAFFSVSDTGHEAIVNYRVNKDYIIVEMVAKRFTLRSGEDIICVYNESLLGNSF